MCSYSLVCEAAFITCEAGQWLGNGHVWSDWSLNEGGDNLGRLGRTTRCDEDHGSVDDDEEQNVWGVVWRKGQFGRLLGSSASMTLWTWPQCPPLPFHNPPCYTIFRKHQNNYNDETDHRITWHCTYTFYTSAINISIQYPSLIVLKDSCMSARLPAVDNMADNVLLRRVDWISDPMFGL